MTLFGAVSSALSIDSQYIMNVESFTMGATAPTTVTIGSTPTTKALHFDATNELVTSNVMTPRNVDFSANPQLILLGALSAVESNNDTLDWTCDYIMVKENELFTKTSTQITAQTTVTTGLGLGIGTLYRSTFTFDRTDATNPWDTAVRSTIFELHLTNITNVGEFDLVSACFAYDGST